MAHNKQDIFCKCNDCQDGRPVKLAERTEKAIEIERTKRGKRHSVSIPIDKPEDIRLS